MSVEARSRLRRRLLVFSAPVALLLIAVIVKSLWVVVAGGSAASAFAERDTAQLRRAVDTLMVFNVIEPAKVHFAAGGLAVLENDLGEADRQYSQSLARSESCATRVNLAFVRETLGDRAAARFDGRSAVAHYLDARSVVEQASPGCFAGNTDPDPQRRTLRNDALSRLDRKIQAAQVAPPPPPTAPEATAPPPPSPSAGPTTDRGQQRWLEPGTPLERLQQILRDAAA
ncbi:hypothetical protein BST36_24960 [Mycolicibacterium moriokaense]|uniref:Uncharacterized protein n=1 Tax=Mycolicibacterium moriokaense TaxID=39691 RepID=A0AAD1H7Y6_9MYCO|nr:hypothetical protein [Mycolicibacterium moriokaense]MCV7039520.1 hypothetical protein [Mycolicibacterium moriokaense]ORB17254.1 hypothetical protein BST36_24960 [Mycolicibacterium moriokaense]BBW99708.1 hypothetical protein MMOR_06450 [Mycolicibacterium moriokaense]